MRHNQLSQEIQVTKADIDGKGVYVGQTKAAVAAPGVSDNVSVYDPAKTGGGKNHEGRNAEAGRLVHGCVTWEYVRAARSTTSDLIRTSSQSKLISELSS